MSYCSAIEFTLTIGSGAGTAYESCLFNVGQQRVYTLRVDFGDWLPYSTHRDSH